MLIRPCRAEDCAALAQLFFETVHAVNCADYTPAQLDAWAPAPPPLEGWTARLMSTRTFVAEAEQGLLGFANLEPGGYLDCLFVRRDCQRQGVGAALCSAVEQAAGPVRMTAEVSLTARGFFEHRGWRVVRCQQVERRGQRLTNFVMERPTVPAGETGVIKY